MIYYYTIFKKAATFFYILSWLLYSRIHQISKLIVSPYCFRRRKYFRTYMVIEYNVQNVSVCSFYLLSYFYLETEGVGFKLCKLN